MLSSQSVCQYPRDTDYDFSQGSFVVFKPVDISISALPLAAFDLIQRPNEGLLLHPPATSCCVCVNGCQSHCSRLVLLLLFAPEPVNQWELRHRCSAETRHQ